MRILAIDPSYSKPIAFAVYRDQTLINYGLIKIEDLPAMMLREKPDVVVCEDQYVNKKRMNYNTIKKTIRSSGWIEGFARYYEIPMVFIHPSKWKSFYKMTSGPKLSREKAKDMAVTAIVDPKVVLESIQGKYKDDVYDAILIGYYGAMNPVVKQSYS